MEFTDQLLFLLLILLILIILVIYVVYKYKNKNNVSIIKLSNDDIEANKYTDVIGNYSYCGYKSGMEVPEISNLSTKIIVDDISGSTDYEKIKNAFDKVNTMPSSMGQIIISFGPRKYTMFNKDGITAVYLKRSNTIIKGVNNQTIIYFPKENPCEIPASKWTATPFINIIGNNDESSIQVIKGNTKGSFSLELKDIKNLKVGDLIMLKTSSNKDPAMMDLVFDNIKERKPKWRVTENGVYITENHRIISITGNTITFREPITFDIIGNWFVSKVNYIEMVGIEDIIFEGTLDDYVHHSSCRSDTGFTAVAFKKITDSYIRRVEFKSFSTSILTTAAAYCTFYNNILTGNSGHSAFSMNTSNHNFIGNIVNQKKSTHNIGVSGNSNTNVIWRCKWLPSQMIEAHASIPVNTLYDNCTGGFGGPGSSYGGAEENLPNHMRGLTFWNFTLLSKATPSNFWNLENTIDSFIVKPRFYGILGTNALDFNIENAGIIMNKGKRMDIDSIYEYQVKQRFGTIPQWITTLKNKD
jgi:hypothetical protein